MLNSFDTPLRQSLINSFVRRPEDLPNAWPSTRCSSTPAASSGPPLAGLLLGLDLRGPVLPINGCLPGPGDRPAAHREPPAERATGLMGQVFRRACGQVATPGPHPDPDPRHGQPTARPTRCQAAGVRAGCLGGDAGTLGVIWGAAGCGTFLGTVSPPTSAATVPGQAVFIGSAVSAVSVMRFRTGGLDALALVAMAGAGFPGSRW